MASYQVNCINKPATGTNQHITHLGYYESIDQPRVVITIGDAIKRIEANKDEFYIGTDKGRVYLTIVKPPGDYKYIKTIADKKGIDDLLSLEDI